MIKRVVLGISGGVDSAVAGLMLKMKGFDVVGVFMRSWDEKDEKGYCAADKEAEDAEWVCNQLDIPFKEVDFVQEYWNDVFSYLLDEYRNGFTPNPDIFCNKHIKFKKFFQYAMEKERADAIATGHYARTSYGDMLENMNVSQGVKLLQAADRRKDQTFFLSQINQAALQKTMFPLGSLQKSSVKNMASSYGLQKIANKDESTGICFIGKRKFADFISEYIADKPGQFVDVETLECVGSHKGFHHWTIGQRCKLAGFDQKYFVSRKDPENNNIYVAKGTHHPSLYTSTVFVNPFHWIHKPPETLLTLGYFKCHIRSQHGHELVVGTVSQSTNNPDGPCIITLDKPQRALTPGQFAVVFQGEECLGSAKIMSSGPTLFDLKETPNVLDDRFCYL